jgi:hypothetical protein
MDSQFEKEWTYVAGPPISGGKIPLVINRLDFFNCYPERFKKK